MNSQLITSILNEPEFAESSESFVEQSGFVEENLINEEEQFYPYHQNENINNTTEACSLQEEVIINSPFINVGSFETGVEADRVFNVANYPEQTSELEQFDSFTPDFANSESNIADQEHDHFHNENAYEEMQGEIDQAENEFANEDLEDENSYETYTDEQEAFETGDAYEHLPDLQIAEVTESQVANIKSKSSSANTKLCEGHTCWAKNVLNQQPGLSLTLNNSLDEQTKKAIGDFQSRNNLPETQKIDAVTERALLEIEALRRHAGTSLQAAAEKTITEAKTKIEDWTKQAVNNKPQHILNSYRDPRKVYAFVLHHMAFKRKGRKSGKYSDPTGYLSTGAHFCIMLDGRIIQLHAMSRMIWHGNCISPRSVAVEFEGNFPNIKGKWWINKESQYQNKDQPTQAQFDSGRFLASYLKMVLGITHILAHRQSSDSRENDPGPDIWYNVGQWAVDKLGLSDGGPNFKCGTGNPILPEWRTWGNKTNLATNQEHYETTEETEWEVDQMKEDETRSYPGISSRAANAYLTVSGEKQGQIKGGVIQKGKEGSIAVYQLRHEITSPRDAASGQATGKRIHKPLVITKEIDMASVKLLNALVTNENLKQVVINFWQPGSTGTKGVSGIETNYYRISLTNAAIANISQELPNPNPAEIKYPSLERVEFVYQKIEWQYLANSPGFASDDWKVSKELEFQEEAEEAEGYEDETINEWDQQELDEFANRVDDFEEPSMEIDEYSESETTEDNFIEEFVSKIPLPDVRKRIDQYFDKANSAYKIDTGKTVNARTQFRIRDGGKILSENAKVKIKKALSGKVEQACGISSLMIHNAAYGRAKPNEVAKITQCLIDVGELEKIRTKNSALSDEQLIRLLQSEFGIGIDCGGYVQLAFIFAFTGNDNDTLATRNMLGLKQRRGDENLGNLPSKHFEKIDKLDAQTGDLLVMNPRANDDGSLHTVIIVDHTKTGNVHRYLVDSSWGFLYGDTVSGVSRRTFQFDASLSEWSDVHPVSGDKVFPGSIGPYKNHPIKGFYRARQKK